MAADSGQRAIDLVSLMTLEDSRRWGETAAPFQWANCRAILDMTSDVKQHWIELPRGARKTTDLAAIQLAALYCQAPPMARLYVGASDEEQAQELIDAAMGLVERTPELEGQFRTGELEITCLRNGASVRALANDASGMGKRAWMLTIDELSNWPETRKARRFWSVLTSGNRKITDCRTIVISNSGDPAHWSFKRRETARTSPHWRFFTLPGPLPWLTSADLEILRENAETDSEYEQLHMNKWTTSEDRLASRADLSACAVLRGPLQPQPGRTYVASLDVGVSNDRSVLCVMHAEDGREGRRVVLDCIDRWQGTRTSPVDLGDVRDTLVRRCREYRASAITDPHEAVLIAQEARARGVLVHEFAFTATSVGRLALSLHQAIRGHHIDLPGDEVLLDELASVRLRKNTLGVYRLDHDSGRHDDQAVAIALGTYWLLEDGSSAAAWIRWARDKAIAAGAVTPEPGEMPAAPPQPALGPAPRRQAAAAQEAPVLEGVTLSPAEARKRARDERYRATPEAAMWRAVTGS